MTTNQQEFRALFDDDSAAEQALQSLFALGDVLPREAAAVKDGTATADETEAFYFWALMRLEMDWELDGDDWELGAD